MDTAQWAQGNIGLVKQMDGSNSNSNSKATAAPSLIERRARPQKDQAINCPRCNSTNTKFCYYNNYSLSQPRYFCKTCRRYWTEGGSLRNVPVGGGSRKNKRSSPSISSSSQSQPQPPSSSSLTKNIIINPDLTTHNHNHNFPQSASQNPKIHQGQDLNLAYPPPTTEDSYNTISKFIELPYSTEHDKTTSAMELLKTASSSRGLNSFMPMNLTEGSAMYNSTAFALQDFKLGVNFGLEGFENGYAGLQGINQQGSGGGGGVGGGGGARMLFPLVEDQLNKQQQQQQVPSSGGEFDHHHQQQQNNRNQGDSTGYWNGMLGGGSW